MMVSILLLAAVTVIERMVPMADGTELYTRAVLPAETGKFPCVFQRDPYVDKGAETNAPYALADAEKSRFVKRGYVWVMQHCRGHGRSKGAFRANREREDGLRTLAWIRSQPWYNGEIFPVGDSYTSTVHLSYLETEPPDIRGAALGVQCDRMYDHRWRNGALWGYGQDATWLRIVRAADKVPRSIEHPDCDAYWTSDERWNATEHIRFPVLFTSGWYDYYIHSMPDMWTRLDPEWKAKSVFVIKGSPHWHYSDALHSVPFAHGKAINPGFSDIDFFDAIRAGKPNARIPYGRFWTYTVGSDTWTTHDWPEKKVETLDLPLGTGELAWTCDPGHKPEGFKFDCALKVFAPGSQEGVATTVLPPFGETRTFFGRPRLKARIRSDADDTQVYFRLALVMEDGSAYHLNEIATTLRYHRKDCRAGETVDVVVDFLPANFTVRKGWSLRLDVASANDIYYPPKTFAHNVIVLDSSILSLPLQSEPLKVIAPQDGAEVSLVDDRVRAYLAKPRAERTVLFTNAAFRTAMTDWERVAKPVKLRWAWSGHFNPTMLVTVEKLPEEREVFRAETSDTYVKVWNLEIARTYRWTVIPPKGCGARGPLTGTFRTAADAPRAITLDNVFNMRDLGGRIGLGGRRVKQGLLYRSAGMNDNANTFDIPESEWRPGRARLSVPNLQALLKLTGIRTDIDLRNPRECYGMTGSPLGPSVRWAQCSSWAYAELGEQKGKDAFVSVFRTLLDPKTYPADFHCITGADRTGTVAFLLNALLGVGLEELYADWELTAIYSPRMDFYHARRLDGLVRVLDAYPGATLAERTAAFFRDCGFADEEIEWFREFMLERK